MKLSEGRVMKRINGYLITAMTVFMLSISTSLCVYADEPENNQDSSQESETQSDDGTFDDAQGGDTGTETDSGTGEEQQEQKETEPEKVEVATEETSETVIENAIQTQIKEAVDALDDSAKECFVEVSEGTYDGNINIDADSLSKIQGEDKTLYILGEGSYQKQGEGDSASVNKESITTDSAGSSSVNGDININGINVVLSGIYFSLGHSISVDSSKTEIYGTNQDDEISVDIGKNADVTIMGGAGSDTISVNDSSQDTGGSASSGTVTETGSREVTIYGGDRDENNENSNDDDCDVYEIDISVGGDQKNKSDSDNNSAAATAVTVKGDENDRLHLSGELDSSKIDTTKHGSSDNPDNTKTYVQSKADNEYIVNLISKNNLTTVIDAKGISTFTDELGGKRTVNIIASDFTDGTLNSGKIDNQTFTNYVYSPDSGTISNITITAEDAAKATGTSFSQLVLGQGGNTVNIEGTVNTNGMNVLALGKTVNIKGTVNTGSGSLVVRAKDSDDYNISISPTARKTLNEVLGKEVVSNEKISLFSIKSSTAINMSGNISGKSIDLKAYSKQSKPLVPFESLKGYNFATVKVGEAFVNISGTISAAGTLLGRAVSTITATASNDVLADWFIPLAAAVLLGEAGVIVNSTANIVAGTIKLLSDSSVNLQVASTVGVIPISTAVSAIMNDSKVEVSGNAKVTSAKNTTLDASGQTFVTTKSRVKNKDKKDSSKDTKDDAKSKDDSDSTKTKAKSSNVYGGFFAVAVAIQNVSSKILENAVVTSQNKNVNVKSESLESVVTTGISAVPATTEKKNGGTDTEDHGKVATDTQEKSDKAGDTSDKRSVENTKENAGNIVDATKKVPTENQAGDKLDEDDNKKLETLSDKIKGKDGDEKETGIDKTFDEATKAADVQDDKSASAKKSKLQLTGAMAVNVVLNSCASIIEASNNSNTIVNAQNGSVNVISDAYTYSKALANAEQVKSDGDNTTKALGAAVAINVTNHTDKAEVVKGTIDAAGLKVAASSGQKTPVTVHTEAVGGISEASDYGIAGAVAVDVASIITKANIGDSIINVRTGNIAVSSVAKEKIKTISTTNVKVKDEGGKVGVGVALSTAVNGIDTISRIGTDANTQPQIFYTAKDIKVISDNDLTEEVTAKTGSVGKIGISPALCVDVSGVHAESNTFFRPASSVDIISGDFTVNTGSKANRTVSADATAQSNTTAGSGALVLTVINDSANATHKGNLKAQNINVNATSQSVLSKARARASSKGAKKAGAGESTDSNKKDDSSGDGDQDKQADEAIDGAKELAKKVDTENINNAKDSTGKEKEGNIEKLTKDHQKAETSEGSVSVAASFILNIMKNTAIARIDSDMVSAINKLSVTSTNKTSAYTLADSSAVAAKSDAGGKADGTTVGVGAAVALNVITIENTACINSSNDVNAGEIVVKATGAKKKEKDVLGDEKEVDDSNSIKTYSVSGAGSAGVGVAGSLAIAVIGGNIDAYMVCKTGDTYRKITSSTGSITISADIANDEETIASASMIKDEGKKKEDKPDKNNEGKSKEAVDDSKKADDGDGDKKTDNGTKVAEVNDDDNSNAGDEAAPPAAGEESKESANKEPEKDSDNNAKNPNATGSKKATSVGVGASFAFNYSSIKTNAYLEAMEVDSKKDLGVLSTENLERKIYSVAGTDPAKKGATHKTSVDASVALLIEKDEVKTLVDKVTQAQIKAAENVKLEATHKGKTRAQSSGFAVGTHSAIGASVAFIYSGSDVVTNFAGNMNAGGTVSIKAETSDADRSLSLATAIGTTEDKAKENSDSQPGDKNNDNKTASLINETLNEKDAKSDKADKEASDEKASNTKALSTNLLKTQNVKTESTETTDESSETGKAVKEAEKTANEEATNKNETGAGENNLGSEKKGNKEKKVDVAAAVGINIANHKAKVNVSGNITTSGKEVSIKATNDATFSALGSAITMTQMPPTDAVAVGAALAVNKGTAVVIIADSSNINTVSNGTKGKIGVEATMNQNKDNLYFGSQAVAGSIAKKAGTGSSKVSAAAAVAILVTDTNVIVNVGNNTTLKGSDIKVSAVDDYKLYVRGGSLSYSRKSNVGLGISMGMLYANDVIHATIGDNATIEGTSLTVEAVKKHNNLVEELTKQLGLLGYVAKVSTVYNNLENNKVISAEEKDGDREIKVNNAGFKSWYTAQEALNVLNIFVSDNYHVEAFSGSFAAGGGKFNGAGGASLVILGTDVKAQIGNNAKITLTGSGVDLSGLSGLEGLSSIPGLASLLKTGNGLTINAEDVASTGVYSIGVGAGSAGNSAGASIAVLIDHSKVYSDLLPGAVVNVTGGGVTISANTLQKSMVVTTAASVTVGKEANSVGGSVNVYVNDHETKASLHENTNVTADKDIKVSAGFDNSALLIVASVQGGRGTAAGGTINVGIYNADTQALVGKENTGTVNLKSNAGNISVTSDSTENLLSVIASASATTSEKAGVAGVIDVLISRAKSYAKILSKGNITAKGNIEVRATSEAMFTAVDASAAIAFSGVAAGGLVQVSVFNRDVQAIVVKGVNLKSEGNTLITAYATDKMTDILAAAEAGKNAFGGIIVIDVQINNIKAALESSQSESSIIDAKGSAGISAYVDSSNMIIAGGANISGKAAAGGIINTVVLNNTIEATADTWAEISSGGLKALVLPSRGSDSNDDGKKKTKGVKKIRGIAIDASERSDFKLISVSGAASGKVAVVGVINTVVSGSRVHASARGHNTLKASLAENITGDDADVPLAITILAYSKNDVIDAAGSLSASGKVGVGVSVVVFTYTSDVEASAKDCATLLTSGKIVVDAQKQDSLFLVSASIAASGKVAVSVAPNVLVYRNTVAAYITGNGATVTAFREVTVSSSAKSNINMIAAVVSASGNAAVSLEGNVIYYSNDSKAYVGSGLVIMSNSNCINIISSTVETLNGGSVGLAGSGTAAIGGSADIVITNVSSQAYTEDNVILSSFKDTTIKATDEYGLVGVAGTIAGSGTAGVGISAVVSVSHNTVKAYTGKNNTLSGFGQTSIKADSIRNLMSFAAAVGASGTAGIGAGVIVIISGKGIDKGSYDAIYTKGKIHPEDIIEDAYKVSDKRAGKGFGKDSLKSEVSSSISPVRNDAACVANTGANGGSYTDYGNGNGKASEELVNKTSQSISGKISDSSDVVYAGVGNGSSVTSNKGITVSSFENVSVLVVSGAVGAAGAAGIGAGAAVVIIASNISSVVDEKASLNSAGDINVEARLIHNKTNFDISKLQWNNGSNKIKASDTVSKAQSNEKESRKSITDLSQYGMLVITGAAAGGYVGVGASTAYYNNSADVRAIVKGSISSTDSNKTVLIRATTDFGNVGVFTVSLGAGAVGVAATVALATNEANVVSAFDTANDGAENNLSNNNVEVIVDNRASLTTINGVLAAGAVGAAVMVSLANNKLTSEAYVGENIKLKAKTLTVRSAIYGEIGAYFANFTAGAIAAGVTVSIANNRANNTARAGKNGNVNSGAHVQVNDLNVSGTVMGEVNAVGAAFSAGAIAANGTVVLAIQNPENNVGLYCINTTAGGSTRVHAGLGGNAVVNVVGVSSGAIGFGTVVAVSYINSSSKAKVSMGGATLKTGTLTVDAGGMSENSSFDSNAETTIITGGAGAITVAINFALAINKAVNEAIFDSIGNVEITGSINVLSNGKANTKATATSATLINGIAGNVTFVSADTNATFKAAWNNKANVTNINADEFNVINNFAVDSKVEYEPTAFGIAFSGAGYDTNMVMATSAVTSEASATGELGNVKRDTRVESVGEKVNADAHIKGVKISISGVKLAASIVNAQVTINNTAFINGLSKEINAANVYVFAKIKGTYSKARGGASGSSVSVNLVGGNLTNVTAKSDITNEAFVVDANIKSSGCLSIRADVANLDTSKGEIGKKAVHVDASADAPDYSIGLSTCQAVQTHTDAVTTVTAKIKGNGLITVSQIDIIAADNTEVSSKGSAPSTSITLASGDSVSVVTEAAKARERLVEANVGENIYIFASGVHDASERNGKPLMDNIIIRAISDLSVATHLNSMSNYSGIKLGTYKFATDVGTTKAIAVMAGVLDTKGSVQVFARDNITSNIDTLSAINAALLASDTSRVTGNISNQNAETIVSGRIDAFTGNVEILAVTSGEMRNKIESSSYGLGSKSNLEASNTYNRNTIVDIKDDTNILAGGNLTVKADAQQVNIISEATGSAGGAVQKAIPQATVNYKEITKVNVGGGCDLTAQLGKTTIVAQSASKLEANAEYTMSGGIESNKPSAIVNSNVDVQVNIAKDSSSPTSIYGGDVEIGAYIDKQYHKPSAKAWTKSFATYTEANSKLTSNNNLSVNIGNALISGYETLYIYSYARDLYEEALSFGSIKGVTGKVHAYSDVSGGTVTNIKVGNKDYKATLYGPDIVIANGFASGISSTNNVKRTATADGATIVNKVVQAVTVVEEVVEKVVKWLPWPLDNLVSWVTKKVTKVVQKVIETVTYSECEAKQTGVYNMDGNVDVNLDLYCSQFAAGINIVLGEDGKAVTTGIPQADRDNYITIEKDKVIVHDIKATKGGKFTVNAYDHKASGNVKVFNRACIPALNIDNYSDLPLYIRKVMLVGDQDRTDDTSIEIRTPEGIKFTYSAEATSKAEINSYGNGDVIFTGGAGDKDRLRYFDFDAGEGSIIIKMQGGNLYTENESFIAANTIIIDGKPNRIGNTERGKGFNVYLFYMAPINTQELQVAEKSAELSVVAVDRILLSVTPVMIIYKDRKELDRTANFLIKSLAADVVNLKVEQQRFSPLFDENGQRGIGNYSIRRYYLNRVNYNCDFWIDNMLSDSAAVIAETPNGNSLFRFLVARDGYKVSKLTLEFANTQRTKWILYPEKESRGGDDGRDNGQSGRTSDNDSYWAALLKLRKALEVQKEKADKDAKAPGIKHLSLNLYNKIRSTSKGRESDNGIASTIIQKFGLKSDLAIGNNLGNLFDQMLGESDLARIVDKNGWSYIILANDMSIESMISSINEKFDVNDSKKYSSNKILALFDELAKKKELAEAIIRLNLMYVTIPLTVLLLLFLLLTKKKEEEIAE